MLYGNAQIDGRGRPSEDRICIKNLLEQCDLFAVFDGHSGSGVVRQTVDLLPKRIQAAMGGVIPPPEQLKSILEKVFVEHDKELARTLAQLPSEREMDDKDSGSTATVAIITPTHIVIGYIGDSPCFLMNPTTTVATNLIIHEMGKHEPTLAGETERIKAAGGTVELDEYGTPRVDGSLMVSRAFGDFTLKYKPLSNPPYDSDWAKMKVTAHPDVVVWERPEAGLLAIMSDGLVETNTNALKPLPRVAADIYHALKKHSYDLPMTAEAVVAGHRRGSVGNSNQKYYGDDLSIVLIDVGKGRGISVGGGAPTVVVPKPLTRKVKVGRRNRTGKKNRLIKMFTC